MHALIDGGITKPCSHCRKDKPLSEFHNDKKGKLGKAWYCKLCANKKAQEHSARYAARKRAQTTERIRRYKAKAVQYKGGQCSDCGGIFPSCVYDFHHEDGDKQYTPSYIIRMSWERAKQELDKCSLLCANCHRERHHARIN